MSCTELQQEEIEVLESIYDGDENFKKIDSTTYQYKYGEDGDNKSVIVEIKWGENYPESSPEINLDLFYNKHILESVKEKIIEHVQQQVEDLLGSCMTYSLFDSIKDNLDTLISDQPDTPQVTQKKEKKEQLTKAQKRRIMDKFGSEKDRPRGWDWVDIVKHLSQTGGQKS
ncbi:hypothetical protein LOTGIDRAFT_180040 [Lottia gigantea]|uniref:RWD domain-containing protein n=1 Tax=Lottia gigantea TaxID=225164 RepID=V4AJ35_LOTGI|nr:hypothetical protein LOTGIDRAFT_180040 [Lottia gigantea]ESP04169.1 hypothetical protein LOTGIDRAFT_180040 [Lottia gigantea]